MTELNKPRTSGSRRARGAEHASVAKRLSAQPWVWGPVAVYRARTTAVSTCVHIRNATFNGFIVYAPARSYETRIEMTDDGWLVEARHVGMPRTPTRKLVYNTPGERGMFITARRLQILGLLLNARGPVTRAFVAGKIGMCPRTAHRILQFLVLNDWARSIRMPGSAGPFVYELTVSGSAEARRLIDADPLADVPRETPGGEA